MTHSGDDEREKLTFAELDKLRRGGDDPRGKPRGAEGQAKRASEQYKKELDSLFSDGPGGQRGEELAQAMRAAHGGDGFVEACRAYRDELGTPLEPDLLGLFLDTGDADLVVGALEAVLAALDAGAEFEATKSLRRQFVTLAEDFDARIADVAEEVVERT